MSGGDSFRFYLYQLLVCVMAVVGFQWWQTLVSCHGSCLFLVVAPAVF